MAKTPPPWAAKPTVDAPEEKEAEELRKEGYKAIGARGVMAAERQADQLRRIADALEKIAEKLAGDPPKEGKPPAVDPL